MSRRAERQVWSLWHSARLRLRRRRGAWHARENPVRGRRRALREEADYWADWLSAGGGKYADEFVRRFDSGADVDDPALREVLGSSQQEEIEILDVGAGPVSTVGYCFPGHVLTVVPVDPLADKYNRLISNAGLVAPVRTQTVEGESLVAHFGVDRFDVAYSRNALDHTVDPVVVIEQMLAVVRPGGHLVLRHGLREAVNEEYVQLHQWNFEEVDGDFIVWRPDRRTNMSEMLARRAEVRCWTESGDTVVCVLRKTATPE